MIVFCKRCPSCNRLYIREEKECRDCKIQLKVVFTERDKYDGISTN